MILTRGIQNYTPLRLSDFHYKLAPERIAQAPVTPRDQARLLAVEAASGAWEHRRFFELDRILRAGDLLVLNATRVFPARLRGRKKSGGKIEILLLERLGDSELWRTLVRGTTRAVTLEFPEGLQAAMEKRLNNGEWTVRFSRGDVREYLERHGEMPLPPYIKRVSREAADKDRYQTVYARQEGAVAAPTAGFHFTPELLERLKAKGVERTEILLHVGWGTFRPIRRENISEHRMLSERYAVSPEAALALNAARRDGRRIVAVGTSAVRTLETVCDNSGGFHSGAGESELFIVPGYRFKAINALITNFHLPDSTPLLLANAFYWNKLTSPPPAEPFVLRRAYQEAIREGYRFYSYGDAMLIQ